MIEHTLSGSNLLKLEGVESGDKQAQMLRVLYQLAKALGDADITRMHFNTWLELFDFVADKIADKKWTLYLEELQWLAQYKDELNCNIQN